MMETTYKEKFKSMSPKDKIDYIWEYYKFHILAGLIVIFIIGSLIHSFVTRVDTYCSLTYYNAYTDEDSFFALQDKLNEIIFPDKNNIAVKFDDIFTDSALAISPNQQFSAKIAAKEVDLAIVSEQVFKQQCSDDMFLNLSELKAFNDLNLPESVLVKGTSFNGEEGVFGLYVSQIPMFKEANFSTNDNILVIIVNSERVEESINTINYLMEN